MDPRRSSRPPANPTAFSRSLGLSLGLHGAAFGAALFVALGSRPGAREGGPPAEVWVAATEPESAWTLASMPEEVASELDPPMLPAPELVPVEVPEDAPVQRLTPDETPLAVALHDWSTTRVDARPLERLERRPAVAEVAPSPTAEAAAPPAPRGEDRALRLLDGPAPAYPRVALRLQQEGSVLLELEVDAAGRVLAAHVLESSGFERLDAAAREGVLAWRFEPALRDGAPVPERFRHRIQFVLE